jgi:hypothetical protein
MSRPLPRFTDQTLTTDPLEIMLAQREAEHTNAIQRIQTGAPMADPADLRGIPCIARGVGGTSPGTNPLTEVCRTDHRLKRNAA